MTTKSTLDADAILELLQADHGHDDADPDEGLRERKKRRVRQQISNTATALFLAHGFENVTVAQIAAACEVSEQTVFNYFPTKETMFFDRSEASADALASALREQDGRALSDAVAGVLLRQIPLDRWTGMDEADVLRLLQLFWETADGSPALAAAQNGDGVRLTTIVAGALATRVGADPEDPEVQITAAVVVGLARTFMRATVRHLRDATSIAALDAAVRADVARAVHLVAPTLDAFDNLDPKEPRARSSKLLQ